MTPLSKISNEILPCLSADSHPPLFISSGLEQPETDDAVDTSIVVSEHRRIIRLSDKLDWLDNPTADEMREIIKIGPCQLNSLFPVDKEGRNCNRSFDQSFCVKKNGKASLTFRRHWLCYSPKLNVVYCLACWFSEMSRNYQCLVNGTANWAHLGRNIDRHKNSTQHVILFETYDRWKASISKHKHRWGMDSIAPSKPCSGPMSSLKDLRRDKTHLTGHRQDRELRRRAKGHFAPGILTKNITP